MGQGFAALVVAGLGSRVTMDIESAHEHYWKNKPYPKKDVRDALRAIEAACEIPAGLLRPDDQMSDLMGPPKTRNPLKWMIYQMYAGDRAYELQRQLKGRLKELSAQQVERTIVTVEDYVSMWCGGAK